MWQHSEGRHGATQIEPHKAAAATVQSSSEAIRDWLGCGWALSHNVSAKVFEKKREWAAWCSGKRCTMPRALSCRRGARSGSGNHRDQRRAGSWRCSHPANAVQNLDPLPQLPRPVRGAGAGHTGERHLELVLGLFGCLARLLFGLGRGVAKPLHASVEPPVYFTRFIWLSPSCEQPQREVFFAQKSTNPN